MTAVQGHFHRRVVYCPGCLLRRVAEQPGFPQPSQSDQGL